MHFYQKFLIVEFFSSATQPIQHWLQKDYLSVKIPFSRLLIRFFIHNNCIFPTKRKIGSTTKAMPLNQKGKKSPIFYHKPSGHKDKGRPKHIGSPKNIHRYPLLRALC